jgi:hypothetical protein
MTPLHAPDAMGEAAHDAAMLASRLDLRLLIAASPNAERKERADALRQAFEQWTYLCAAMSELEASAPTVAAQARERTDRVRDFRERTPQAEGESSRDGLKIERQRAAS